jgi:hypothetical protein
MNLEIRQTTVKSSWWCVQEDEYIYSWVFGYPQPGGGTHPPIPRGEVLGEVQSDYANLAWGQERKNTRI